MKSRHSFRRFSWSAVVTCLFLFSLGCGYRSDTSNVFKHAEAVRLAAFNTHNYGTPVDIEGVVTYCDPEWHLLFVQDSSGGLFLALRDTDPIFQVGTRVAIKGKLASPSVGLEDTHFQVLGTSRMPVAQPMPTGIDPKQLRVGQWVEVEGTIRLASIEDGRLTLTIVNGNERTRVRILDRRHLPTVSLVGAKLHLNGVSAAAVDEKGNWTGLQVFVTSADDLRFDTKPANPYTTRPDSFENVLESRQTGQIVHLSGTVVQRTAEGILVLSDGTRTLKALLADSSQFASGDGIELIGFTSASMNYQIEDAIVRMIAPRKPLDESHLTGALHTLRELKSLSVEAAMKQFPVEVEGKVTFIDISSSLLFVQDATAGVYVDIHNQSPDLHLGDLVHVEGVSAPGDYAPIIAHPKIKVLMHGALPKPSTLSWQALASGNSDGSWVQVSGVVRSVRQLESQRSFKLAVGGNTFPMQFPRSMDVTALQNRLLDAQVRINAVCGTIFNERRQLTGVKFFVPDVANIQIVEPPPTGAAGAVRPIVSLLRFDPLNLSIHRVRVRGVVTLQDKNQNFYVQDSSAGIYVVAEQQTLLRPGQVVEVSGFPVADPQGPYLDDASITPVDWGLTITPAKLAPNALSTGSYNSQLVTVEGTLLEQITGSDQSVLILQSGPVVFRARLRGNLSPDVRRGSLLKVTGILQRDDQSTPSYRIALRSEDDVHVVQAASWWTPEHTARISVAALIVILVVLLWVVVSAYRIRLYQAKHDSLTGLQNRNTTLEYLERQMARAIREGASIAVILADVDNFKKINDTHGHLAGDAVLRRIANLFNADLRPYDAVGRYGGEEFLIVVPNCDAAMAREVAERIRFRVQRDKFAPVLPAKSLPVTCSFGVAIASDRTWSVDSLLAAADRALYDAKNQGRNQTVLDEIEPPRVMRASR
jgi:diguanylate cyclase (GGDEF)-like protein